MIKSIEQRKKLEQELTLAEETQRSLLPQSLPRVQNLNIHAFSKPTRYVGGDFYDFLELESGELFGVLADVSGKGISASLLSSMLLGCLQMQLRRRCRHPGGAEPLESVSLRKILRQPFRNDVRVHHEFGRLRQIHQRRTQSDLYIPCRNGRNRGAALE